MKKHYEPYLDDIELQKLAACGDYFKHQMKDNPYGKKETVLTDMLSFAINQNDLNAFTILTSEDMRNHHKTLLNPKKIKGGFAAFDGSELPALLGVEPPLHLAVSNGHVQMVKKLIEFGADPNLKNDSGRTAFDIVATLTGSKAKQIKKSLDSAALKKLKGIRGHRNKKLIDKWLSKDENQREPLVGLLYEVLFDSIDTYRRSLEEEKTRPEKTFDFILSDSFKYIRKEIISYGPKGQDENNKSTLLSMAVWKNNVDFVRRLLEVSAVDINVKDFSLRFSNNGYTPLHAAISDQKIDIVKLLLLEYEPDLTIKSKKNETPLELAKRKAGDAKDNEILRILEEHLNTSAEKEVSEGKMEEVKESTEEEIKVGSISGNEDKNKEKSESSEMSQMKEISSDRPEASNSSTGRGEGIQQYPDETKIHKYIAKEVFGEAYFDKFMATLDKDQFEQTEDRLGKLNTMVENLEWTAFGRDRFEASDLNGMWGFMGLYLDGVDPKLSSLTQPQKNALQNVLAYSGKLFNEFREAGKKPGELTSLNTKINAAAEFITTILESENLTDEVINDAVNTFEQKDVNRSAGSFYKVHSFFKSFPSGKRYEENGHRPLVKSTMGEFAYDFAQTLKVKPTKGKADDVTDDRTITSGK